MKKLLKQLFSLVLCCSICSIALAQNISGTITDADGSPLIGASVLVKGTTNGTVTDELGEFSINASDGDVLLVSYIGYKTQSVEVGSNSSFNFQLMEDSAQLDELVITATRQPIRRIESTTAIDVVSNEILATIKPEGFSEAIQGTPGMYTSQSQGRFRGAIFTRGFPDGSGNGLVYTGILLDGLPTLATTARPPDFAFGMDDNVEKIEVVRGSAATMFGRASAAGVVNIISKVGGEETHGSVNVIRYNNNVQDGVNSDGDRTGMDFKISANLNGPINDKLRYNVGGFIVNDKGFRDLGYNDRGGQFRFNLDYLDDKFTARLYGGFVDLSIQNMIDIPYKLSDNSPADGWDIYDSYYSPNMDTMTYTVINKEGNVESRESRATNEDGNYATGFNAGFKFDYKLTDKLTLSNNLRYQSYDHGTKFNLGVSTGYVDAPFSQIRILIDGDGNDTDFMDEIRLSYNADGGNVNHNLTAGAFFSTGWYSPVTYSLVGWASVDRADNGLHGFFPPPAFPAPTSASQARIDEYTITVASFFAGDELSTDDDKLRMNFGLRYDQINMDLTGFYDVDRNVANREEFHSDVSFSLGANYKLNARSAVYGNYVNAFRMPDYSAYSPVDSLSFNPNDPTLGDNPRITDNERINNIELGYRTGFGDLGIDIAGFYTQINNRLATIYEGAIAIQRPLGTNIIAGGELSLTYTPERVTGLLIRASATLQNATFGDFKIALDTADPEGNLYDNKRVTEGTDAEGNTVFSLDLNGNQLPRVPSTILNFAASYNFKYFDISAQINHFANRFADATNVWKQDDITNINLGATVKLPLKTGNVKIGILAKNLINTDKALRFLYVADNDAAIGLRQRIDSGDLDPENAYYTGIPFLPRRILINLAYEF